MSIHEELKRALEQLAHAWQNFRYADPDYIDVALAELQAAESRVNLLYVQIKQSA